MSDYSSNFLVVGAGGHSRVIIETIEILGFSIEGIIDLNFSGKKERILKYPVLGGLNFLKNIQKDQFSFAVAVGNISERKNIFKKLNELEMNLPNIIHPTAIISKYLKLGRGVFINAGSIINAKVILGNNIIINTGVIIDHEVEIEDHCNINPGVRIGGRVKVGKYSNIGIGSSIIDSIAIGSNSVVAAGSVVIKSIESNTTVYGVPARRKK